MNHPTHILIDDREYRSGVIKALAKYEGIFFEKSHLEIGDYLINDQVLIERKTVHDFLESIKSGRLYKQAFQMAGSKYRCMFLLEGTKQDVQRSKMRRKSVQGAMLMIGVRFGLPILRSLDAEESALLIYMASRQSISCQNHLLTNKPRIHYHIPEPVNCLCSVSGIGPNRARELIKAFGDLSAVSNAHPDALISVPGIGIKTAQHIHAIFHQNFSS